MTDQSDTCNAGIFSRRTNQTSTHRCAVHGGHKAVVPAVNPAAAPAEAATCRVQRGPPHHGGPPREHCLLEIEHAAKTIT
eukprot:1160408-Prorocentrum_minimum.AAC.1